MDAEAYVASLSETAIAQLRSLASSDRNALCERLKALGFTKLGQRMKIEVLLQSAASQVSTQAACIAPSEQTHYDRSDDISLPSAAEEAQPNSEQSNLLPPPLSRGADSKASDFMPASTFEDAKPGYFFARGPKGLGYYRDVKLKLLDRGERVMAGNLSWLSEETFDDPDDRKTAMQAEATAQTTAKEETVATAAAAQTQADRIAMEKLPPGMARSLYVGQKPAPFAPSLKEGKYADVGHMVKVLDGRHAGKWGQVKEIKMHAFTVEMEDGQVELGMHFQSLKTTELKPKYFELERQKHVRLEEQRAWVRRNGVVMPANLTNARLTFNGRAEDATVVGSLQAGFSTYKEPVEARGAPLPLKKNRQRAFALDAQPSPQQV